MTNLVLTRKAGQSVRLIIGDKTEYVEILTVNTDRCLIRLRSTFQSESVRFKDSLKIAEGISVEVVDLSKGYAKLNFTAPRDVHILRTELIKEDV